MPELAEVETVKRTLKKQILNKQILNIEVLYPKMIENDLDEFKHLLLNQSFIDILRKGKYLIFELNNHYLISHLRMEGKFFLKKKTDTITKHEHVIISFNDCDLRYHDTRKFGRMKIIPKAELNNYFANLGPDANSEKIDITNLQKQINQRKLPIKSILLDQSIMAGLGNIYADEVLFASHINPLTSGKDITKEQAQKIVKNSREILTKAIEYKGTTIRSYTSSLNVKGEYQQFLKVHTKEVCECGTKINKIKINGRSTYYCPRCQKEN